jgi:uncharacterized membrane protein
MTDPGRPGHDRITLPPKGSDVTDRSWPVPAALFLLAAIPVTAGALLLVQLAGGGDFYPDPARFLASPVPVVTHVLAVITYSLLGALQFVPALRRSRWHRRAGRILVPAGLLSALSGLWMTLFYPRPAGYGTAVTVERLVFGTAMAVSIVIGYRAIRRGDVAVHRAWMLRGYAIGMGAGTQAFTAGAWLVAAGTPGELGVAVTMGAGWVINLAVAEWLIRRQRRAAAPPAVAVAATA